MPTQRRYRATSATIALNVALAIATPAAAQDARTGDAADRRQAAAVTGVCFNPFASPRQDHAEVGADQFRSTGPSEAHEPAGDVEHSAILRAIKR
jgi:hypothetical protein